MDLSTEYLGLSLRTPLVPSASPLSEDLGAIRRLEDAGASAIVLHSLFEEQLEQEARDLHHHLTHGTHSFAEALTYFPEPGDMVIGPEAYLDQIRQAKAAVEIPIIASLNGWNPGAWTDFARQMQQAGADAIELNIYHVPADPDRDAASIEADYLEVVREVRGAVSIPLAVKLSPYFTNMTHFAREVVAAGARGLVLFNRFYQPDINLETLEVEPHPTLSTAAAARLPLRWIAILSGRVDADLAATSGVHSEHDALKMLMAGASVTMLCSVLLKRGIDHLATIEAGLRHWLEEHEYESVRQLQGCLSQRHCPDPAAFERAQYVRTLHHFHFGHWSRPM